MEQNALCFSPHILWIWIILPMYHDFLGPKGLQGTHMGTLKPKNSKLITFTVRGGFFTFWAILAHSASPPILPTLPIHHLRSWSKTFYVFKSALCDIRKKNYFQNLYLKLHRLAFKSLNFWKYSRNFYVWVAIKYQ